MKYKFSLFNSLLFLPFFVLQLSSCKSLSNACRHNEFRCEDGSACLKAEKLCNDVPDCPRGEDERGTKTWNCSTLLLGYSNCDSQKEIKCRFGGCIPREKSCDGVADCWGGNDEGIDLCGPGAKILQKVPPKITITSVSDGSTIKCTTINTGASIKSKKGKGSPYEEESDPSINEFNISLNVEIQCFVKMNNLMKILKFNIIQDL